MKFNFSDSAPGKRERDSVGLAFHLARATPTYVTKGAARRITGKKAPGKRADSEKNEEEEEGGRWKESARNDSPRARPNQPVKARSG